METNREYAARMHAALNQRDFATSLSGSGIRHGTTPEAVEAVLERRPTSPRAGVSAGCSEVTSM